VARERRYEDDRDPEERAQSRLSSQDYLQMERARRLVDAARLAKDPARARAVLESIKLSDPDKQKLPMLTLRAKVAEVEGKKADALVLYRAAMDARKTKPTGKDPLAEDLQRLWKELGGSAETLAMLLDKPKAEAVTDSRWEKPKNPLPAFSLADLTGKTWKLVNLEGKALLINIWATWCGPCVAEHPEFQKLYDKLKDRPDVSVFSFNVDDDLGKVAPYIAEHKYTFPVMPAKDVVDAVVPALAIPRNWLVSPKGKLEWEQVGFGSDREWEAKMLAKLDEVAKMK
jgi:thiol-disulfide isomerase/thioredoxin